MKLHAWAIKAAGFQRVRVPTEFRDVETYDAAVQFDGTHSTASISKEVLATRIAALHKTAVILNNVANKLRTI